MRVKDKYEISVWKDYLVPETSTIPAHYKEKKIAIIGSDSMTSDHRVFDPILTENVNGTNNLSFKMYYALREDSFEFQEQSNDLLSTATKKYQNPFLGLLVNEAKIKLLWKNKWYDFVVKDINEDSTDKSITYVCRDLYINELSKNGFNLEFDYELENNQGTVIELGEKVLADTDWEVDIDASDIIQEEKEEPVYEVKALAGFMALNETTGKEEGIPIGSDLLLFYSSVQNRDSYVQFLYNREGQFKRDLNSQLVIENDCYSVNLTSITDDGNSENEFFGRIYNSVIFKAYLSDISLDYRGSRLKRSQVTILDPVIGKYVKKYKTKNMSFVLPGQTAYGFRETLYKDPTIVTNLLTNPRNFSNLEGWVGPDLLFQLYPPYEDEADLSTYVADSYLRLKENEVYWNNGLQMSSSHVPEGFISGDKYVIRLKASLDSNGKPSIQSIDPNDINPFIAKTLVSEDGYNYPDGSRYFSISNNPVVTGDNWIEWEMTCVQSITRAEIYSKRLGFFLRYIRKDMWLKEIEFFPLVMGTNNENQTVRINPGEMEKQSIVETYYSYYLENENKGILDPDDYKYIYRGTEEISEDVLEPVYNENFIKIRSISGSKSNCFNWLQTIAENFQCWVRFRIDHNEETGEIACIDGVPQKFVSFVKEVGEKTGVGFHYGIDLKGVGRNIESEQIVTKTIVSPNNNEFAEDGFCTIARSEENYSRDTFILNFDYYVSQGLLDSGELSKDLYLPVGDGLGYYYNLNRLNGRYDALTETIIQKSEELNKQNAFLKTYEETVSSLQGRVQELQAEIFNLSGTKSWAAATRYIKANPHFVELQVKMNVLVSTKNNLRIYENQRNSISQSILTLTNALEEARNERKTTLQEIKDLHYKFYKKYSRFIQEGSWIDETYIDDDLYYLDGLNVAHTASRPQISYVIEVIRLSGLEDFKNKVFKKGDIAYIQDEEFFGHVMIDGFKTPYKEEVLISEVISNLDAPEQDSFVVRNYRTQFEDLFQRVNSMTESLQYSEGQYRKAASVVQPDGSLNPASLEATFAQNSIKLSNSRNQSVLWDESGISIINLLRPSEVVRLVSGGIFVSKDGGENWTGAITGTGINTSQLVAGTVNTSKIHIMSGSSPTFRWDEKGLTAYNFNLDSGGTPQGIDFTKFVRFDQYGLYGVDLDSVANLEEFEPTSLEYVRDNSIFSLTWKGFRLKSSYPGGGYFSISSENDLEIFRDEELKAVHLGYLSEGHYGLKFYDQEGKVSFISTEFGGLQSGNYMSGQSGWRISPEGAVEFENASIRGSLKSTVFTYDEVNAQGGSLIIAKSSTLASDLDITPTIGLTVAFKTRDTTGDVFKVDEVIRVLTHISPEIKVSLWLKILTVDFKDYTAKILKSDLSTPYTLPAGTPLVCYGEKESGYLILRADDKEFGPYLDVVKNIEEDVTNPSAQRVMVRLGDLSGIGDASYGMTPQGYGLYAENVFLTGAFSLPNAGMIDYQKPNNEDSIRIWAGGLYADVINGEDKNINFKVYESGKMILGRGESPAFTFNPSDNSVMLGGNTRINIKQVDDLPPVYGVLIEGKDIMKDETNTVLKARLFRNGVDITDSEPEDSFNFEWFINGVSFGESIENGGLDKIATGRIMEIKSEEINESALITCTYSYI